MTLVAAVSFPALAQERGKTEAVSGGVYRRPLGHDPRTLDPARARDIYSLSVVEQIFDGLVQFDQTLTIAPALAQFWKASRDGLVWTFTLRRGVKFHDGRELTSEDVVYSLTRILDPRVNSVVAGLFGNINGTREFRAGTAKEVAGLAAIDRYTVRVVLDEASVPFVSLLAVGHAKILPKDVVERAGEAFGAHPIGTGPFKFVRWERSREIVLRANSEYFGSPPKLARVVYRIFNGEQVDAMYEDFVRGGLEETPIPMRDYRRILSQPNQLYVKRPMLGIRFYGFNTRMKPFNDRRVRQAFVHAINHEALIEGVFQGRYTVARGVLPPGTLGFNPKLVGHAYDPARARKLLAEAGYPGGRGLPTIAIWSSVKDEGFVRMHDYIKRWLADVGIQAEVHYETDWPSFSRMLSEGKLMIHLYSWYADVPDPDNFLYRLFYSRSPQNYTGYASAAVDELLLQARNAPDVQHRVELYRRAEQLIVGDAPIIPIWHYTYERLFQPYVRSVEVNGLGDPYIPLRKIWLDRKR